MSQSFNQYIVYVGTYTEDKSEGIYGFKLDIATGNLEPMGVLAKLKTSPYLAVNKDSRYLYSILETDDYDHELTGGVGAFLIDAKTGRLTLLNCQPTKSKVPCHIQVDSSNKYLFAANYKEGTVTVFSINEDGSIGSLLSIIKHEGSGLNPDRQEKAHTHYIALTPDEKYICAVDLGIDRIMTYDFNHKNGHLKLNDRFSVNINSGSGPRHMTFHPNGKFAYLINELSSDIVALEYLPSTAGFVQLQTISTLPKEYIGNSSGAAIHISPDGKFLYASNRGHDSIAVFKIDKLSGRLEVISHSPTLGNFPRDFAIDPTGKFLIAANQNSDTIVTFKIDPESGKLIPTGNIYDVPTPVCVKFAHI